MMKIQLDQRLKDYMKENKFQDILITSMMCHTWGGSRLEVSARFVDTDEATVLKNDGFQQIDHELGHAFIRRIPERTEETVTLGLSRFIKRITVAGIYSA